MEIEPLESWGMGPQPLIIAGPCSAESEEQVLDIARALRAEPVESVAGLQSYLRLLRCSLLF